MARPTNAVIVEDEAHVRVFLRLILKELGIETIGEAGDGGQGLALIEAQRPELVLLDMNLPVLSGLQVLARLAENHPDLPVIVVSSQRAKQTVIECHRLGAIAYILKDSPKDETLAILRGAIESLEDDDPPGGEAA